MLKKLFSRRRRAYTFVANQPVESFRGMTTHQIQDAVQAHTSFTSSVITYLGYKPRRLDGLTRPGAVSVSFRLRMDSDGEAADFMAAANAIMGDIAVITLFKPDKTAMTIDALFADTGHGAPRTSAD